MVAHALSALVVAAAVAAPPPRAHESMFWRTATTADPPQLFALTARSSDAALVPFAVFDGLEKLDAAAALIWVTTSGKGGPNPTFARLRWPPRLADFRVDRGWEGQPANRIQQRLVWISAGGWRLDVRVYFGTQHPSRALLEAVQAELNRLLVPRR